MRNTTKIKLNYTKTKSALLYTDNSTKIIDDKLVGKYTLKNAEKLLNSGDYSTDYTDNVKSCKVLSVEYVTETYEVDCEHLQFFIDNNINDENIVKLVEDTANK